MTSLFSIVLAAILGLLAVASAIGFILQRRATEPGSVARRCRMKPMAEATASRPRIAASTRENILVMPCAPHPRAR